MAGNNGNELGQRFSPYMFAGIGISMIKISRDYSGLNTHYFASATNLLSGLNADTLHVLPRATIGVPVGLGLEYFLTSRISVTAETNLRYAFTDYLDGFSHSGNPKRRDAYHSHTIGVLYRFGGKNKSDCPVVKP
jgi:opacity protein-like surface antigen